jgi:hypothetical protein
LVRREAIANAQLFEALPCTPKAALCGAHLEPEDVSSLGVGSALHIAEDQDGPKVFGHLFEDGLHLTRGLSALRVTGGISAGVRDVGRFAGNPLADPGATPVLGQHAACDGEHPRGQLFGTMDRVDPSEDHDEDLLCGLVGIDARAGEASTPLKNCRQPVFAEGIDGKAVTTADGIPVTGGRRATHAAKRFFTLVVGVCFVHDVSIPDRSWKEEEICESDAKRPIAVR